MSYYILKEGKPTRCSDIKEWARWFETADRQLALTKLPGCDVSTIFLGLDHAFTTEGSPVLWETMVFGGDLDGEQQRYTSEEAARAGHEAMVQRCRLRK